MKLQALEKILIERHPTVAGADIRDALSFFLGIPRLEIPFCSDREIDGEDAKRIHAMIAERAAGKPLQYIFGEASFRNLDLFVGPGVLIPRPETEMLVDLAMEALKDSRKPRICDCGTGSGAIALALATELPEASVVGVDASSAALKFAERNKKRVEARNVEFVLADMFPPHLPSSEKSVDGDRRFDLITANLPYVSRRFYDELPREVREFEPQEALLSGNDGLDSIRALASRATTRLKPEGVIILEHSPEQSGDIRAILAGNGFENTATIRDLTGKDRFTTGCAPISTPCDRIA